VSDHLANFYTSLNIIENPKEICLTQHYKDLPSQWDYILCDVVSSTVAIKNGKYKEVNFIGAACIIAVLNSIQKLDIPYVFGGDGATFLLPSSLTPVALGALAELQTLAKNEYALDLRVSYMPSKEFLSLGNEAKVARLGISKGQSIALFWGDCFALAEILLKARAYEPLQRGVFSHTSLSLEGLECRWQPLASKKGQIVSVIIKALSKESRENSITYSELLEEIEIICGHKNEASPLSLKSLKLTVNPNDLKIENNAKGSSFSKLQKLLSLLKISILTVIAKFLMKFNMRFAGVHWGRYQNEVIQNSDFFKFDEMLRFVFDVSPAQKRALLACLDARKREAKIAYGLHSSDSALMTCLVFDRNTNHLHFIDGNNGGYAMAAQELKSSFV